MDMYFEFIYLYIWVNNLLYDMVTLFQFEGYNFAI